MKKILLFLWMIILAVPGIAQVVTIGTGTTGSYMVPINTFYNYSYTQQIYTESEIGPQTGVIRSIYFQYIHASPQTKTNLSVYLGNTTKSSFSSTSDWVSASDMTEVFNGSVTFNSSGTGNWVEIALDDGFNWDGTSNLVVCILNNHGSYSTSSNHTFNTHAAVGNMTLRYQTDASAIDPTAFSLSGTMQADRPNIQLEFGNPISCPRPSGLSFSNPSTTSIDVSWVEEGYASQWEIEYKPSSETDWSNADNDFVFDDNTVLYNLSVNTAYDFRIRAVCAPGDESLWREGSFRTNCDAITDIPWLENFDTYGTAVGTRPDCWRFPVINNNFPSIITGASYVNSAPASLKFQSQVGVHTYAITPQFADDINELRVKFQLKREGASSGTMEVGVMSDFMDISTFELVEVIDPADNNFHLYEVGFGGTDLSGPDNFIAIRHNSNASNWYYWLDDVEVDYIPDCAKPSNITVSNITETEAEVSWNPGNQGDFAWYLYYRQSGSQYWDSVYTTDNPHTLDNLTGSNAYEVMLKTDCGNELSEESMTRTFRTECAPITDIPWMDNFDSYGTGTTIFPDCWTRNTTQTDRPYVNATSYSGAGSLYFYAGTAGTYNIAALPKFDESIDISELRLNFMYRNTYATDVLKIGVMEDPTDETTWEEIETITAPTTATWYPYEVSLVSYEGNANYIALRVDYTTTYCYAYVDELVVSYIPDCASPANVEVSNITETEADVSWIPGNTDDYAWYIYYRVAGTPYWDSVYVTSSPHTITGLTGSSGYEVAMSTDCGSELSEQSFPVTFRTACAPITDIPWADNFDTYGTGTTVFPDCWTRNTTQTDRPYVNTTSYSGSGSLYFYASSGNYNIAAIPKMDASIDISELRLNFWYRNTNATDVLKIGVMEDPEDETTWEEVDVVSLPATTTWYPMEVSLASYEGTGQYIAFRVGSSTVSAYAYIDELIVSYIPDCAKPTHITFSNVTIDDADISWASGNVDDYAWWLYHREAGTTYWDSVEVFNIPYNLTGLSANTEYEVYMRTNCGDEISEPSQTFSFTTPCEPIDGATDLPWEEGFEGLSAASTLPDCWSATGFGTYTNTQIVDYGSRNRDARTGTGAAYFRYGANDSFTTPAFYLYQGDVYEFSFWYVTDGLTGWQTLQATVNLPDGTTEVIGDPVNTPGNTTYEEYYATIEAFEEGYYSFNIEITSTTSPWYLTFDDVKLRIAPDCLKPSGIQLASLGSTSVDVEWTPGRSTDNAWWLYHREQGETTWDSVYTFDNPHTLDNLIDNTPYQVMLRTDCGTELSDASAIFDFRTSCDPISDLPWFEDFDTYGTGTTVFPECWTRNTTYTDRPYVNATSYEGAGSLYFYSGTAGTYNIAATPPIDESIDISELRVRFMYRNTLATDVLKIGVMTDPNDESTWEEIDQVTASATASWEEREVSFAPYEGSGNFIAFRIDHTGTQIYAYIDNVEVSYIPDCARPTNVHAVDNTTTSIDIEWTPGKPNDNAWWLYYRASGAEDWDSVYTTDNPHTLYPLSPSSGYEIVLRTDCGNELSEASFPVTLRTECDAISTLPWVEDFDGYSTITGTRPDCWSFPVINNNFPSLVTGASYVNSAPASLKFQSQIGTHTYAITPQFTEDINELRVKFHLRREGASSGTFEVGVMSDPTDLSTFELVETLNPADYVFHDYEVGFGGTTLSGPDNYIAFRHDANASNWYYWLDDVIVDYIPDCAKPTNISSDNAMASSVDLSWNVGNQGDDAWWIRYRVTGATTWDSVYTNDNPHTLTGLTPATRYEINIRTDCVDEVSELSNNHFFNTTCHDGPITDFPWEEGFEAGLFCWSQEHTVGAVDWTQSANNTAPRTGTGYASFYESAYALSSTMLISPQLDISSMVSPHVSFWHTQEDWIGDQDELKVHYRESGQDDWTELEHYTTSIGSYVFDSIALPNPSATYQIAFEGLSYYGYGIALDDVTVYDADADGCAPPTGVTVTPSNTYATVTWTPSGEELSWEVRLGSSGDVEIAPTPSHIVDGLTASTNYTVYVRSNCGTGYSNWVSASFITTDQQVAPEVTASVSSAQITQTTAVLTGEYLQGSDMIESKGFEYKKASENDWTEAEVSGDDNPYTYLAENLVADTDYEVKAYVVTNTEGTTYSDVIEFTTEAITPPDVTTDEVVVNNIDRTATFTGTTAQNTEQIIARGFEYKKDEDDWASAVELTATGSASITATTPVLDNEQEYMVRAYAETVSGKTYGEELDFEITSSLSSIDIDNLDITLYPNPATNTTTISIKGIDGKVSISIIDIQGRTITSIDKNSSSNEIKHSFDLEGLAKGVYYIRVNAENSIKTQKLIIQ